MELTKALCTLIADGLSASTKTLSDRAFVHGDFWREFCNGATLHCAALKSGDSL